MRRLNAFVLSATAWTAVLAGCGSPAAVSNIPSTRQVVLTNPTEILRVMSTQYQPQRHNVVITVKGGTVNAKTLKNVNGENYLDVSQHEGIVNYATAHEYDRNVQTIEVKKAVDGRVLLTRISVPPDQAQPLGSSAQTMEDQSALPVASQAQASYIVTNGGWVSYHSRPRLSSQVLGRLQQGQKAPLLSQANRYWYEINVNGQIAYITTSPRYVSVVTSSATGVGSSPSSSGTSSGTSGSPSTGTSGTSSTSTPAPGASAGTTTSTASSAASSSISLPPPGVRIDNSITPMAPLSASVSAKAQAVLSEAQTKLGTPYIWGHNEDRGQYGFDCSNFTEYVYHHALGYLMTTSSRGQYLYVGVQVPVSQMRAGDLMIFNQGQHCGIYAGNGQMIEEGGGLGKVGYLSVKPGSYWGDHISAIKRVF